MFRDRFIKILLCVLVSTIFSFNVNASDQSRWDDFSDCATYVLATSSLAIPAYNKDIDGIKESAFSIGSAGVISIIGKSLINEDRPDHSGNDSFPSNHTSIAFASATNLHIRYGWQVGLPAYSLASLIAVGRVEAEKHYWKDVIAGAAIGSVTAYFFTTSLNNNVSILPWIDKHQTGLSISMRW